MASAISQLAGAPLANILVIAAMACIAIAIFGWAKETLAASAGFRAFAGLTGALLLFFVYGIYLPHAVRSKEPARPNGAQSERAAETRSAATQQAAAKQTQALARQPGQSSQMAALSSPTSIQEPATANEASTTPLLPKDGRNGAPQPPEQQQSSQPSAPQTPAQNFFSGRWKNADPKAASILVMRVEERGGEISVRAWGTCQHANGTRAGEPISQYCDWGTGHGLVRDGAATVTWKQGAVLRRMKLEPDGGSLRVVLDSTLRGRPQHVEAHFTKGL